MKKLQDILKNVVLVIGSLFVSVLLCEGLLRLVTGDDYLAIEPVLISSTLLYEPNQHVRFRMFGEIDTSITINSQGFRDDEYNAKPSDRAVLALGDSFTEGWGVDLHESYPKLLALKLRDSPLRVDHVYSAGHYATNPKHYVAVYRNHFRSNKAIDLVTMGFFLGNDIVEQRTPDHFPDRNETTSRNLKLLLSKNSAVYNFLRRQVRYSRSLESIASLLGLTNPPAFAGDIYVSQDKSRWKYTGEYILDFYHTLVEDNRDFLLILIPTKEMIDQDFFRDTLRASDTPPEEIDLYGFRDFLLSFCLKNDIPVIDLTSSFQERFEETKVDLYFNADDHWNKAGHEYAAEVLFERIISGH